MEAFWPRVLLMIVVIVLGISFNKDIGNPQKEMQTELGVLQSQGMDIIKEQAAESTTTIVSGQTLKNTVTRLSGTTAKVFVGGTEVTGDPSNAAIVLSKKYMQSITTSGGIVTYTYTLQP